jgi:hypothetical protein
MALKIIQRFFGAAPNELLNNPQISLKAKGLYSYLNSKPENWDFSVESIANQVKEGVDSVRAAVHELEGFGYLIREKYQNEKGFWEVDYLLFASPIEAEAYLGKSNEGKTHKQYKKEDIKKDSIKKEEIPPKSPKGEKWNHETNNDPIDKKGLDEAVDLWLEYKKEKRQNYKGTKSTQVMINNLWKMSNGNFSRAMEIVEFSMGNNYSGLVEPRQSKNNFTSNAHQPSSIPVKQKVEYYNTRWPDRIYICTEEQFQQICEGNPEESYVIKRKYSA